ncbi:MAG: thiamine pyrophosphate-dependent dehydrogenase E1 component subunit alpha [Porticoccaceae bacterium]|jgi:2-oxoisovalerate dehydrogenase E1 component alpha subunit|nr:thiamine pyrophosphate-dependent dehydrogenase E1 component subunit alpha [Porticoccaceae bacterium]MBT7376432.1 thiamine pyrophosphate-dependent dehydrogenase E1 component subunit alpha [Porticoccaceae bacterium]
MAIDNHAEVTSSLAFLDSAALRIPTLSLLQADGSLTTGAKAPPLHQKLAEKLYRDMLYIRCLDERMVGAQRQGRLSFYLTCTGEEAAVAGTIAAFQPEDMVMAQYREQLALRFRGFSTAEFMNQLFSNAQDVGKGRQMPVHYGSRKLNFMTISSPLATQIPQAAGYAYGQKLSGQDACTLCYFGEGAASEGDFHAGLNMAAVLNCPVVFVARNNGYAISTPASEQYAGDGIAARGIGYGIKTIRVDGNDILAVYAAALEARKIALNNSCPVLIETMSYRLGAHSTSDDPSGYRSAEEEQQWRQKDPITRMKNWLIKQQWWQEEVDQELQKSFRSEILQELKAAEKRPKPALDTLISDVYKTPPAHLLRQLTDLESHVAKYPESYQMHGEGGR